MSNEKYISRIIIPNDATVIVDDSNTISILGNKDKVESTEKKDIVLEGDSLCINT